MTVKSKPPAKPRFPFWKWPWFVIVAFLSLTIEFRRTGALIDAWGIGDYVRFHSWRRLAQRYAENNRFSRKLREWDERYAFPD